MNTKFSKNYKWILTMNVDDTTDTSSSCKTGTSIDEVHK